MKKHSFAIAASAVVLASLVAACTQPLGSRAPSAIPAGKGMISISIPHISPLLQKLAASRATAKAGRAFTVADRVHLELFSSTGTSLGIKDISIATDPNNPGSAAVAWAVSPATGVTLTASVYNNLYDSGNTPEESGTSPSFDIVEGAISPVTIDCVPTTPATLVYGTASATQTLAVPYQISPTGALVAPGSDHWLSFTPTDGLIYIYAQLPTESAALPYGLVFDSRGRRILPYAGTEADPIRPLPAIYKVAPNAQYYLLLLDAGVGLPADRGFTVTAAVATFLLQDSFDVPGYADRWALDPLLSVEGGRVKAVDNGQGLRSKQKYPQNVYIEADVEKIGSDDHGNWDFRIVLDEIGYEGGIRFDTEGVDGINIGDIRLDQQESKYTMDGGEIDRGTMTLVSCDGRIQFRFKNSAGKELMTPVMDVPTFTASTISIWLAAHANTPRYVDNVRIRPIPDGETPFGVSTLPLIGLAIYNAEDRFMDYVRQSFITAASGQAALDSFDGKNDQTIQNSQIDQMVADGAISLAVNLVDPAAMPAIIDKAKAKGTPLVFFNREPDPIGLATYNNAYYVGSMASQAGVLQGEIVADYWNGHPEADLNHDGIMQYVQLVGDPQNWDAKCRSQYSIQTVRDKGIAMQKIAEESAMWDQKKAGNQMATWLGSFPGQIEVVFANNDDMAIGAIDALKSLNYPGDGKKIPVVGVDATWMALDAIRAGTMIGTVLNDAKGQGKASYDLAFSLATTGVAATSVAPFADADGTADLAGRYVWVPYQKVTPANVAQF
jgi:methyl-galactoside transport system substrate-binding protein